MTERNTVLVEEGQTAIVSTAQRVATTVVRARNEAFWVSTIRFLNREGRPYETLVFPLPTDAEVVPVGDTGQTAFTREPHWRETSQEGIGQFNRTNMVTKRTAIRHHEKAVHSTAQVLGK